LILTGSGVGMIVLSSQVLVLQYFEQRRALAAGIALSGYSFGALISGPLIHFMINTYAWRGTLTLISGIFLQIAVLGSLFRPPFEPRKVSTHKDGVLESSANGELRPAVDTNSYDDTGSKKQKHKLSGVCELCRRFFVASFNFSLLKDTSFCLYIISIFCVHIGLTTFLQHTPSRAVHYGVQPNLVAVLPTITGVSLGVSRIIFGFVANAPRFVDRMLQYGVTAALSGAVQMATGLATSFETMVVYCIVLGVCNGKLNTF
jgi:MFS family permease